MARPVHTFTHFHIFTPALHFKMVLLPFISYLKENCCHNGGQHEARGQEDAAHKQRVYLDAPSLALAVICPRVVRVQGGARLRRRCGAPHSSDKQFNNDGIEL